MEGRYRNHQECQKSLENIFSFLSFGGTFHQNNISGRAYCTLVTIFMCACSLQAIVSTVYNLEDVSKAAGAMYHANFFSFIVLANLTSLAYPEMMNTIRIETTFSYDYDSEVMRDLKEKLIWSRKEKHWYIIVKIFRFWTTFAISSIFVSGVVDKYSGKARYLQIYDAWYPSFLDQENFLVELLMYFFHLTATTCAAFGCYITLLTVYFYYVHLTTELLILQEAIFNISNRANEIGEKEEINLCLAYRKALKMCVEHYMLLIKYYLTVKRVLVIYCTYSYISGTLLLVCTAIIFLSGNEAAIGKFVVINISQMTYFFFMSWFGEELVRKNELVNQALFEMDWQELPKNCISNYKTFLILSQKPLNITMFIGQQVNLDGFMTLIKGSYSYFNMVYATTREKNN
uniref:Odorant receptor n=1 Tax=Yemma signatus TaxID=300820 RepID=A0A385H523_9HEMI|nr:odorant receptor [Yemma signatus]